MINVAARPSFLCFLFYWFCAIIVATCEEYVLDGGDSGWDKNSWRVQLDGVMGGDSSGDLRFENDGNTMVFTGDIVTEGGGFSSVRRRYGGNNRESIDLSLYNGIIIEVEPVEYTTSTNNKNIRPPLGLHLQFHHRGSRYSFAGAFAIPLFSAADGNNSDKTTKIYIPMEDFSRGSTIGYRCDDCSLDWSRINEMDIYVLFQEGDFEVRIRSITATTDIGHQFEPPSNVPFVSTSDVVEFLSATITSGGSLYNMDYIELCAAMYWSAVNTVIASSIITPAVKQVACAGLLESMTSTAGDDSGSSGSSDKASGIAWTLRYTMDSIVDDLQNSNRRRNFPSWLPEKNDAEDAVVVDGYEQCPAITSATQNEYYVEQALQLTFPPTTKSPSSSPQGWSWSWRPYWFWRG